MRYNTIADCQNIWQCDTIRFMVSNSMRQYEEKKIGEDFFTPIFLRDADGYVVTVNFPYISALVNYRLWQVTTSKTYNVYADGRGLGKVCAGRLIDRLQKLTFPTGFSFFLSFFVFSFFLSFFLCFFFLSVNNTTTKY